MDECSATSPVLSSPSPSVPTHAAPSGLQSTMQPPLPPSPAPPTTNQGSAVHIGNACGPSLVSHTALGGVTSKSGSVAVTGGVESSQLAEVLDARVASSTTAIIPSDPGAELILQQAESSLLTEESMYYALLQQDSLDSPLSYHWNLPPSNLIKSALGRAAWLRNQVQRWQQIPLSELQACLQYILSLLPQELITSANQRLWQMQPSVVLTFCRAMVAAQCSASVYLGLSKQSKGVCCK